ncbi:MAG TPA: sugar phosphate isomerase/epimerase [Candidatus Hydrogenedentes bacterium]|nr:sugar phosphate isomerase/epimerase [Candidatus Hydrogenedentota bacterium]HPG69553.1 sugar phosphate isomerase/epimerase [Candidatus Hydrogenedentota bacterium]
MRFGIVTDELSQEPREAIEMALAWGIRDFELRGIRGARFPRFDVAVLDELAALREEYDIRYTAVSPGFFKCHLEDEAEVGYALGEGLDIAMDFMEGCDIPLLICFGFEMDTGTDNEAIKLLQRLADRLDERALHGAVENETHCKFNTPARIADLLRRINRPNLGANWDYANLKEYALRGFPDGYEKVKRYILNVHVKDVALNDDGMTEWKPVGEGVCDWRGQIKALARDGLVEHVTIENHCGPPERVGPQNLKTLRGYLAKK